MFTKQLSFSEAKSRIKRAKTLIIQNLEITIYSKTSWNEHVALLSFYKWETEAEGSEVLADFGTQNATPTPALCTAFSTIKEVQ